MKKLFLGVFIGLILASLFAFKVVYDATKKTAEVKQQNGLLIFQQCTPVLDYEVLGSEKINLTLTGQPTELLNAMLKKATKKYNNADGIIIINEDMDKFDIIRFKD